MKNVHSSERDRRFKVRNPEQLLLTVESQLGAQYKMFVSNCSVNGISAHSADFNFEEEGAPKVGDLIVASKITGPEGLEIAMGRLVLRRSDSRDDLANFGDRKSVV